MKNNFLVLYLLFFSFSCAQVNKDSRALYYQNKKMRHGLNVIPIEEIHENEKLDFQAANRGRKVYLNKCSECHGDQGRGVYLEHLGRKSADLQKIIKEVPNFRFTIELSQTIGGMPGWKNYLGEQEIRDLSHYLRSLAQK